MSLLKTRSGTFYESPVSCMAFPVGVNKNNIAAHYSPCEWENGVLDLMCDSVSIDFGLFEPTTGALTDGAFTWNAVEHSESAQLTQFAQDAVDVVIRESGPDAVLGELGATCQELIQSKEVVIEGCEERKSVQVLKDLCGHSIAPYTIHAGKAVPCIALPNYTLRMKEGESYAVEVFPTTGSGESVEVPLDKEIPTHLALRGDVLKQLKTVQNDYVAKLIRILTTRKCVPFHPEWYSVSDEIIRGGIQDKLWNSYPTIKSADDSVVVQWEKMIRVEESGVKLLVQA